MLSRLLLLILFSLTLHGSLEAVFAQVSEEVKQGTAAERPSMAQQRNVEGDRLRQDPGEQPFMDFGTIAAQIAFLVFIGLFLVIYIFIRRQPNSRELKKKNKRKL